MKKIESILFVCLGNTARSPAAEYLAKHYAELYDLNLKIESAGFINAFSYMQSQSRSYLSAKDIDYSDFHPQIVNRKLIERNDLIITMEKSHKVDIINTYRNIDDIKNKIYTLKEFNGASEDLDIIDPYYTSSSLYSKVLKEIDENIKRLILKIKEINK
jgi:protein-tyrosine phosphatase